MITNRNFILLLLFLPEVQIIPRDLKELCRNRTLAKWLAKRHQVFLIFLLLQFFTRNFYVIIINTGLSKGRLLLIFSFRTTATSLAVYHLPIFPFPECLDA